MAMTSPGRTRPTAAWATAALAATSSGRRSTNESGPGGLGGSAPPWTRRSRPGVGELLQVAADGVERHAQPQRQVRGADLALGAQPAQDQLTALLAEQLPRGVDGGHAAQNSAKSRKKSHGREAGALQPLARSRRGRRTRSARPPPRCPRGRMAHRDRRGHALRARVDRDIAPASARATHTAPAPVAIDAGARIDADGCVTRFVSGSMRDTECRRRWSPTPHLRLYAIATGSDPDR